MSKMEMSPRSDLRSEPMTMAVSVRKIKIVGVLILLSFTAVFSYNWTDPDAKYLDANQPIEVRVADLMSKLTVSQKAAQCAIRKDEVPGLIPYYRSGNEALHGIVRPGKFTVFPQAIALASSWDTTLMHSITVAMSDESRARYNQYNGLPPGVANNDGLLHFFSPTVNMARDPRWGRTQETYGEDPFLTGRLGIAFVTGLQGNDPKYIKAGVGVKHFAVNNEEHNRYYGNAIVPGQILMEYYLAAYKAIVQDAKPTCLMAAYNSLNGVPCCANKWLNTDVLRKQWGFTGYVVSDCGGINHLYDDYGSKYVSSASEAAAAAMNAGVDMDCEDGEGSYNGPLMDAFNAGLITAATIDTACKRVLTMYFRTGMFDYFVNPSLIPWSTIPPSKVGSPEHVQLARKASQKSIILLKNSAINGKSLLPINKSGLSKITVVGPRADVFEIGNYSCEAGPANPPVTPLAGLKDKLNGSSVNIDYVEWSNDATQSAASADLVIAFMGNPTGAYQQFESENTDRDDIMLPGDQTDYLKQIYGVNKKIVLVLINSGPVSIPWEADNIPAIIEAWFAGEQGGNGMADVLFGDYNPAGRLPVTIYTGLNQLLDFSDYDITKGRTYMYFQGKPVFPFGHGLSYTTFSYANLQVSSPMIGVGCTTDVKIDITNSGSLAGDEVPQLYIHDNSTTVKRPVKQLKGFARVSFQPAETKTVTFRLPYSDLAYYDTTAKNWAVSQGAFDIMVGASSQEIKATAKITADKNANCSTTGILETAGPGQVAQPHAAVNGAIASPSVSISNRMLHVNFHSSISGSARLTLITLEGKRVLGVVNQDCRDAVVIPMRGRIAAGAYLLQIKTINGLFSKRVVIR